MRKVLLISSLAFMSTSAFATTARLQALGQDTARGSFFIDDNYNVFRNAAYVNDYSNYVVTEWGDEDGDINSGKEQLEGGFFRDMGSFAYGIYFNNEDSLAESYSQGTDSFIDSGEKFKEANNTLDLFFGGDMGVKWGARLQYAKSEDQIAEADVDNDITTGSYTMEHSSLAASFGIMMGDLGAYANYTLKNEYKGAYAVDISDPADSDTTDAGEGDADMASDVLDAGGSLNVGVNYKMGNMKFYADYAKSSMEYTDGSDTSFKKEHNRTAITVGVGHTHEVSSSARIYTQLSYTNQKEETIVSAAQTTEETDTALPLLIGFEVDANSWLAWRGHITQNLPFMAKNEITDSSDATQNEENNGESSTAFAAGATLNFGKLKVDGIIGGQSGNADEINTDTLMSKVAVIYNF